MGKRRTGNNHGINTGKRIFDFDPDEYVAIKNENDCGKIDSEENLLRSDKMKHNEHGKASFILGNDEILSNKNNGKQKVKLSSRSLEIDSEFLIMSGQKMPFKNYPNDFHLLQNTQNQTNNDVCINSNGFVESARFSNIQKFYCDEPNLIQNQNLKKNRQILNPDNKFLSMIIIRIVRR